MLHEDLRYALRSLARSRGFAVAAILTIAFSVGANTAVFSVVHAVLLRRLPFPESDRLVAIHETTLQSPEERHEISYPNFDDWRRDAQSVEMAAYSVYGHTLVAGRTAEVLEGARVSWNYFRILGVRPALGRDFVPEDDTETAAPVVIIGDDVWIRIFGRDPSVIGRVVTINGDPRTIVGVMPPDFAGPPDETGLQDVAEIWAPVSRFLPTGSLRSRGVGWISPVVARLRPGVTVEDVQAELDRVTTRLAEQFPAENRNRGAIVVPLRDQFYGGISHFLLVLFGAVGLVLLAACVNVAGLLLARSASRGRELALRRALGASQGRVVRLLLTESLLISMTGGAAGLLLAGWMLGGLLAISPEPLPRFVHAGITLPVLGFTLLVCIAAGVLFGTATSLSTARVDVLPALKAASHAHAESASPRLRRGLVAAQVACAVVIFVGSGLMIRTVGQLRAFNPGFNLSGVLTMTVLAPIEATQATARAPEALERAVLDRVRALPTVREASLSFDLPLTDTWLQARAQIVGREGESIRIRRHMVAPGYFQVLRIPVLEGRDIEASDGRDASRYVALISQRLARQNWPGTSPLGQQLRLGQRTYDIVGVVGDVRHRTLLEPETSDPDVYFSLYQVSMRGFNVAVRGTSDPETLAADVREVIREVSPTSPVFRVGTGDQILGAQIRRQRFMSALLSAFAMLALSLTVVGVYGVAAYNVSRQTRQIGLRVALGATPASIVRQVLGGELSWVLAGLVIGGVAARMLTGVLSTLLYGVAPGDLPTYALAAALLTVTAVVACLVPARRALVIDPVAALRVE
jgi:predicted permease